MKKKKKQVECNEKQVEYIKVFKPTPTYLFIKREKWLREMSLNGWELIRCHYGTYEFKKSRPKDLYFFLYGDTWKADKPSWLYYAMLVKYSDWKIKVETDGAMAIGTETITVIDPKKMDDDFWIYMNIRDKYVKRQLILGIITFVWMFANGIYLPTGTGYFWLYLISLPALLFLIFFVYGLIICKKYDKTKGYMAEKSKMKEIIKRDKRMYKP